VRLSGSSRTTVGELSGEGLTGACSAPPPRVDVALRWGLNRQRLRRRGHARALQRWPEDHGKRQCRPDRPRKHPCVKPPHRPVPSETCAPFEAAQTGQSRLADTACHPLAGQSQDTVQLHWRQYGGRTFPEPKRSLDSTGASLSERHLDPQAYSDNVDKRPPPQPSAPTLIPTYGRSPLTFSAKSATDIAPMSPAVRSRTPTVSASISLSPMTSM